MTSNKNTTAVIVGGVLGGLIPLLLLTLWYVFYYRRRHKQQSLDEAQGAESAVSASGESLSGSVTPRDQDEEDAASSSSFQLEYKMQGRTVTHERTSKLTSLDDPSQ